jgi:hypothetical protein
MQLISGCKLRPLARGDGQAQTGVRIMEQKDRRAAVAAYEERKVAMGVYVVRCSATGQQWAGDAPDLATIWNRLSFTLRQGSAQQRTLQAAWREHGPDCFTFDVLERMDSEEVAYVRQRVLRGRLDHWCSALQAERI